MSLTSRRPMTKAEAANNIDIVKDALVSGLVGSGSSEGRGSSRRVDINVDPSWTPPMNKSGKPKAVTRKKGNADRVLFVGGPWDGKIWKRRLKDNKPKVAAAAGRPTHDVIVPDSTEFVSTLGSYLYDRKLDAWRWRGNQ